MDEGPGYLNGILSLVLNTAEPTAQYSEEEQRAVPYFHRSRAAELLAMLDAKFPNASSRPELHAQLIEFYAGSGESDAVIKAGRAFLAGFPNASQRTAISLLMADAYSRESATTNEFAIYDSVLQELASEVQNVPLGAASAGSEFAYPYARQTAAKSSGQEESEDSEDQAVDQNTGRRRASSDAFRINASNSNAAPSGARSPEYARVLERYLARLVEMKQVPQALAVLRCEIDRNPDDPGLYVRLAVFLNQNRQVTARVHD